MLDVNKNNKTASASNNVILNDVYYSTLEPLAKFRYREKVHICGFDPYLFKMF